MNEKNIAGVIYILTNPSFPDYVKIGYATDIKKRLAQLNRTENVRLLSILSTTTLLY